MDKLFDNLKKGMNIAINGAEKLTKVVKNKSVHIYDVTKLNLALNDTQGKLDKHYQKIGEIIYGKYLDNRDLDEEIENYCEEIDAFIAEINELKERISTLKNTSLCPSCGQNTEKGSEYCSKCGSKLAGNDDDVIQVVDVDDISKTVDVID